MIILAIETSCDETAIALVETKRKKPPDFKVLSNIVSSQVKIHAKYGGIHPFLAQREHKKNLPLVLKRALKEAKFARGQTKIDLIAVTIGPGLEPCLWKGINFAKDLAQKFNLPLVPVNHIEAHFFSNWLAPSKLEPQKVFPAIFLLVSGGHTQLILAKNFRNYKILGETRDDAAGECFDKVARILGLAYPGGPAIENEASKFKISNLQFQIKLPRPMLHQKNYDFSFSGLKTAVLYHFKGQSPKTQKSKDYIGEMAKEIQQAVIDVLIKKTFFAVQNYKIKNITLGGGVASNKELRKQFREKIKEEKIKVKLLIPPPKYCTDNAAMVGITGFFRFSKDKKKMKKKIEAKADLKISSGL